MNTANLSIVVLFGLPLIAQYIWLATGKTGLSKDSMWGYTPQTFRDISIFTIIISFIAGIYASYYLIFKYGEKDNKFVWMSMVGLTLLVASSNFWIPSMIADNRIGSVLTLTVAAIGSLVTLTSIILDSNDFDTYKIAAVVSGAILVFQTTIMDAIVWNVYNYPK